MEKPVFDVANVNVPANLFLASTHISAEKLAAREELAVAMAGTTVKVTVCKPKEAPKPRKWKATRKPANDNREPTHWPFFDKLRRDGLYEDADLVEQYRGLVDIMEVNPLQGQDATRATCGVEVEHRSAKMDTKDIDAAAKAGWPSDKVKGGDVLYKEQRQMTKAEGVAGRAVAAKDTTAVRVRPMGVKFNERVLIAQIDMRHVLPRLRLAMGPVLSPFESAVLDACTFGEIGEARHFKGKQAEAAGKALVMTALDALREEWTKIRHEQRQAEEQADRNAERKRAELAARRATFLSRAA